MCALSATFLASCSASAPTGAKLAAQQQLIFPMVPFFSGDHAVVVPSLVLDPAFEGDAYSIQVLSMIQTQLVTFDNNLNLIGDAAQSWTPSDGGKTWTFKLRTGLKWSDGTPMTAADFVAGMIHVLDPNQAAATTPYNTPASSGTANQGAPYLSYIVGATELLNSKVTTLPQTLPGIATPDDTTLIFKLTQPISFFPQQLATASSIPLERSVFAKYGYLYFEHFPEGVGQSGPFMIAGFSNPAKPEVKDPEHSTQIHFVRNPNWWGKAPTLTDVIMPLYDGLDEEYNDFVKNKSVGGGTLDFTTVPSHEYPFTKNLPNFHEVQSLSIDYFGMNWLSQPFTSLKVRQSFALALNKQFLVDTVFQGARTPTNHIIPQGMPGHNPKLRNPPDASGSPALTGNQNAAKQFIQQVANGCIQVYDPGLCPFIVGQKPVTASIQEVSSGGKDCPNFQVGVAKDDPKKSTQTPIVIYVPPSNPDRVRLANAAAQIWSNTLCLNVVAKADGSFLNEIFSSLGKPTKATIWTLGWVADYPDPQDFTTNLFDPTSSNNTANIGYPQGANADLVQAMRNADKESDPTKRMGLYQQIEQQLIDAVAWIPYDQPKYLYRLRATVQGLVVPSDQVIPDQGWSSIFIEAQ